MTETTWPEHQEFEREWWGSCVNTYGEETKQLTYAHRMGLRIVEAGGHWPVYDLAGRSVVDIGGGPASILLKTVNGGSMMVVDPCEYPEWVAARYLTARIAYFREPAETFVGGGFDEAWIYNVLQHVQDPEKVVAQARQAAPVVRVFEWVEMPPHLGHPHELHAADLERWLGLGNYQVETMHENGCHGVAFYGVAGR